MTIYSLDILLSQFGTSPLFRVRFYCCFLTSIQVSQETHQEVCFFHLFKNFPQFVVTHTVKGCGIVNNAEVDFFLELSWFFFLIIQRMLAISSLLPLPFLKPARTSGSSWFTYYWSLAWRILSITLLACAATAAAKSLQSCLTLYDPVDGSTPGSPVPGIFQARTLEWLPFPLPMHESEKWKWSHSVVSDS